MNFTPDEIRALAIFEGLPEAHLEWFCDRGERVVLAKGEHMFEIGMPADAMWVVVKGVIQGFEEHGGQWLLVATTHAGEVTGMLPFSRMTHYPRITIATEPSEVLKLDASLFEELLSVSYEVGRRLVAQMSDRVRGDVRLEQQSEKMISLGRLSAGLAHELNNPTAAIGRAASRLSEQQATLAALTISLVRHHPSEEALQELDRLRRLCEEAEPGRRSTLEQSAVEDAISDYLEERDVAEPWDVAATLAEAGIEIGDLEGLATRLTPEALPDALAWLGAVIESGGIAGEIKAAAGRISELVASIRTYSHMDRSPEHKPTDVRAGIDNTLTMLGHKLKKKAIRVVRDYDEALPRIPANAGELNQVWTNLIDNAVDAVDEGGTLTLRTRLNDLWVEVEVIDDGPGIPDELRSRIFEPFFTTKEVGIGTGLGLGIAMRIVRVHQGHIEVRSRPGETVMCVRLPVARTVPAPA